MFTARRSREGAPSIRLHWFRSLLARDKITHEGMPVTSVARTLLDLAATVRADRLERALARAEARFLWLARDAGLPEPLTNFSLVALDQPASEVDFYWPTYRLVVEIDGWETHGTRAAFEADRRRDAALHAAGERVLRFTWRAIVGDGATVVDRLRAAAR